MCNLDTQSEQDFAGFCRRQGWCIEKLPVMPNTRTPDFKVTTPTDYEFITEVTELDPLPPPPPGEPRVRALTLGDTLRAKLREKRGQVRPYADDYPTLIVVAAGTDPRAELDSTAFDAALYGGLAIGVAVPNDPRQGIRFDDEMHNAGGRFFGADFNTSVSAVAALNGRPQILRVYHNRFARTPLEPNRLLLGAEHVEHYEKGDQVGWIRFLQR